MEKRDDHPVVGLGILLYHFRGVCDMYNTKPRRMFGSIGGRWVWTFQISFE